MSDPKGPTPKTGISLAQALQGEAASLWSDLGKDVRRAIANVVGRATATDVTADGLVTVTSPQPGSDVTRSISRLAGSVVNAGDDVITLIMPGGHEIALGAIATDLDTGGVRGVSNSAGVTLDLTRGQLTANPAFGSAAGQLARGSDLATVTARNFGRRVSADQTTSSNGIAMTLSELSVPVLANQVWVVDAYLQVGSASSSGGVRIVIGGSPTALTRAVVKGSTTDPASRTSEVFVWTGNSMFGSSVYAAGRSDGWVEIHACVSCGATTGNFAMGFLSWASGVNATVYKNSYVRAQNIT